MTHSAFDHAPSQLAEIDLHDVALDGAAHGGAGAPAGLDFDAIRRQAQAYCPRTAARYTSVDPASVNRPLALRMGNECLAEMGPLQSMFARGPIQTAINRAFPK
jgi:hypothetical protein